MSITSSPSSALIVTSDSLPAIVITSSPFAELISRVALAALEVITSSPSPVTRVTLASEALESISTTLLSAPPKDTEAVTEAPLIFTLSEPLASSIVTSAPLPLIT